MSICFRKIVLIKKRMTTTITIRLPAMVLVFQIKQRSPKTKAP